MDGDIDSTDKSIAQARLEGVALGRDALSHVGVRAGYAGYQRGSEFGGWHVRNRVLLPRLGRWGTRDPIGYVDGQNFLEYARSNTLVNNDPSGLTIVGGWPGGAFGAIMRLALEPGIDDEDWPCCAERASEAGQLIHGSLDGASGRTVCCDGRWVACVFGPSHNSGDGLGAENQYEKQVEYDCTKEHEQDHVDDANEKGAECNDPDPTQENDVGGDYGTTSKKDHSNGEGDASMREADCYESAKAGCNGDADCEKKMDAWKSEAEFDAAGHYTDAVFADD